MCQNAMLSSASQEALPAREKSPKLQVATVAFAAVFLALLITGTAAAVVAISSSVEGDVLIAKAPQDPASYIAASAFARSQGDQDTAIAILEKGQIKANPSAELLIELAEVYAQQQRFAEAEATLKIAQAVDRDHTRSWLALADLYWRLEWREQALATLREAVDQDEESVAARYRLVYGLAASGEAAAAQKLCLEYLASWPESPQLLVALGETLEEQNKLREAFTCYGRAISFDDEMAAAYSRRGRLYCLFRQYDAAELACRQALDLDPYDPIAHAYLGIACAERGQILEANMHAAVAEDAGMQMDVVWAKLNW
jgi:tetratricopeptide (TPR) repeat protein